MAYATVEDVQARMTRTLSESEQAVCTTMLDDAAVLIDSYNVNASVDAKLVVSCRVVIRAIGDGGDLNVPLGASQGSMSALGYSQSWTLGTGGSVGEVYLSKTDKKMLGCGNSIASYSPTEELVPDLGVWS
jgi:hypothetical protein